MKIYFERSGGYAGISTEAMIDTTTLPEAEAQNLCALIEDATFFELPAQLTKTAARGADHFQYKVTIADTDQEHTIETTDMAAPEALRPLLRQLTLLARRV